MTGTDRHVDVDVLDARIRIALPDDAPDAAETTLRELWRRCLAPADGAAPARTVGQDQPWVDPVAACTALTQTVTHAAIEAGAGTLLMFHAGAVCHPVSGAAFAYAAPGGTGKTTLTARLGTRWAYLTDETVAIRDAHSLDGRVRDLVLPYPKPLSRRVPDRPTKVEASPDELGLLECAVTPWLAGFAVLQRSAEPIEARAERLDLSDALVRLAPESSSLVLLSRPLRRMADLIERADGLLLLHYSEAEELEALVEPILRRVS